MRTRRFVTLNRGTDPSNDILNLHGLTQCRRPVSHFNKRWAGFASRNAVTVTSRVMHPTTT